MSRGAECGMNANCARAALVLHVVSFSVAFGEGVHRSPVESGGENGVVSQTVKQSGYPKYNVRGLLGSPTIIQHVWRGMYSNDALQLDYPLISMCHYFPAEPQNS